MLVSVIIPNYNHSLFLKQRIESVLSQTYQNFEIILLDDCSKDDSWEIIEQYRNHPKVTQILFNEQNSGSTFKQWNKGIKLAKGDIIWLAESDDVADKDFLQTLVPEFAKHEETGLVYAQSYRLNEKNEITGTWLSWTDTLDSNQFIKLGSNEFVTDFCMNGLVFINRFLIHKNTIPNASGVLFKKSIYLQVGGADETVKNCSDWFLWVKMLLISEVAFVAKSLNYFRYHDGSVIANAIKMGSPDKYWETYDKTMRKQLKKYLGAFSPKSKILKNINKKNNSYILEDEGLEAVFEIKKKRKLNGYFKLLKATVAGPTLSFIRLWLRTD